MVDAVRKLSDRERFLAVGKHDGAIALIAITACGAADAWAMTSDLFIAQLIALINAVVAGILLARIFHEWGHFVGARLGGSYSPMVREPGGEFIFGFNFGKNTREQFLKMSFGGIGANWLLVLLVVILIPIDSWSRAALLAVVVARAIAVVVFEGPIVARAMSGIDPEASLNEGLNNGSQDRGRVWGYTAGALLWLVTI